MDCGKYKKIKKPQKILKLKREYNLVLECLTIDQSMYLVNIEPSKQTYIRIRNLVNMNEKFRKKTKEFY
jgi:hypothetical protein